MGILQSCCVTFAPACFFFRNAITNLSLIFKKNTHEIIEPNCGEFFSVGEKYGETIKLDTKIKTDQKPNLVQTLSQNNHF